MDPIALKPEEAARLLGVGRSLMYRMIAAGELPTIRVGADHRVPVDALKKWVADRTEGAESCKTA